MFVNKGVRETRCVTEFIEKREPAEGLAVKEVPFEEKKSDELQAQSLTGRVGHAQRRTICLCDRFMMHYRLCTTHFVVRG